VIRYGIVAPPRQGKTTTLLRLARRLSERGVTVTGVAQPARCGHGLVTGYELQDIPEGTRHPLATRERPRGALARPAPGQVPPRETLAFRFDDAGMAWAAERVLRPADLLLVDELGWLEARGEGHLPAVQTALSLGRHRAVVLAIRQEARDAIEARLGVVTGFGPTPDLVDRLVQRLMRDLDQEM